MSETHPDDPHDYEDVTVYDLDADADELTIEHTATFDEGLFATPAVLDGKVYLRTKTTMWAFGEVE